MFPLKTDVVPNVVWPATTQKILRACAPPASITFAAELISRFWAIWNTQTSVSPPERVTSVGIVNPVLHLYNPGASVIPPMFPAPNSVAVGFVIPAPVVYAFSISPIAVVMFAGVGSAYPGAYTFPVINDDVAYEEAAGRINPNPVI